MIRRHSEIADGTGHAAVRCNELVDLVAVRPSVRHHTTRPVASPGVRVRPTRIGLALFSMGAARAPATDVALLSMLEPIMARSGCGSSSASTRAYRPSSVALSFSSHSPHTRCTRHPGPAPPMDCTTNVDRDKAPSPEPGGVFQGTQAGVKYSTRSSDGGRSRRRART